MPALMLATLSALVATSASPGAAAAAPAAPEPTVHLLEQPAFVRLGADMPFRVALDGPTDGLELRAVIHRYVGSRIAFERTVGGDRLGPVLTTASAPVAGLPAAEHGGRLFTLPLQDPNLPRDESRVRLALPSTVRAGVYPVEIELWNPDRDEAVSRFVTHLVAVAPTADGAPVGSPLNVAWIWRISAAPATQPDGRLSPSFRHDVAPGGRLGRIAGLLPDASAVPVTLSISPETVSSWQDAAKLDPAAQSGLNAVRDAAQTDEVLASPYVPVDGPSLEAAGLGEEVTRQLTEGRDALGAALAVRGASRTTNAAPLDAVSLARLQQSGIDRMIVGTDQLSPASATDQYTPARPFQLSTGVQRFDAVETNDDLARLLTGSGSSALRAERLLAGLAVVALELPNQARGVAVDTPPRWNPDPALVNAVLAGLTNNPLLGPTSIDGLFQHVPAEQTRNGPVVRSLAPVTPAPAPVAPAAYLGSRARLDALASMIGADDPTIDRGQEALLLSLTSAWPGAVGKRRSGAQLAGIDATVRDYAAGIQAPEGRTVTLTSRTAEIPVSLLNSTGRAVTVRVQLESEKLKFPEGAARVLTLAPRNTTTRFAVEARASGTFPLRVVVTSEDGALPLQQARYTIRSAVFSGVGIFLTIGAGLFLAIWWITHWRRSRRRPVPASALAP